MIEGPETNRSRAEEGDVMGEAGPAMSARSARSDGGASARNSARTERDPDTFRSAMTTSRAHSAIAALAAQRHALEARLASVEAALENEGKRQFHKARGTGGAGKTKKSTKGRK